MRIQGPSSCSTNALQVPADGDSRFLEAFLSAEERRVWNRVRRLSEVVHISQLGVVTNGYVTGANDFFIQTKANALLAGIPEDWLRPTVRNAASLRGLDFSLHDISSLEAADQQHRPQQAPDRPPEGDDQGSDQVRVHSSSVSCRRRRGR